MSAKSNTKPPPLFCFSAPAKPDRRLFVLKISTKTAEEQSVFATPVHGSVTECQYSKPAWPSSLENASDRNNSL